MGMTTSAAGRSERATAKGGAGEVINSTMTTTNPGTLLSCATEVPSAKRRGTGVFVGALAAPATQGRELPRWISFNGTAAHATNVVLGYVQADTDLPTIKQFRVPLSLRERSP
jgi:hypothetical protein